MDITKPIKKKMGVLLNVTRNADNFAIGSKIRKFGVFDN